MVKLMKLNLKSIIAGSMQIVVLSVGAGIAYTGLALDLELNRSVDAKNKGGVSAADLNRQGQVFTSLSINRSLSLIAEDKITSASVIEERDSSANSILARTGRAGFVFSYGLFDHLELNLGVTGSHENMAEVHHERTYGHLNLNEAGQDAAEYNADTYGYAGSSAMIKIKIFEQDSLRITLAPYLYEGLGHSAKTSLTKEERVRGGWKSIVSYSYENWDIDLNGGYRYRYPTEVSEIRVRNSRFAETALTYNFSSHFAVFANGKLDYLKVSDSAKQDLGVPRNWETIMAAEFGGGIIARNQGWEYSVYGAGSKESTKGLGYGRGFFAMSIGIPMNAPNGRVQIVDKPIQYEKTSIKEDVLVKDQKPKNDYQEMLGTVDYLKDLDSGSKNVDEIDFNNPAEKYAPAKVPQYGDINAIEMELVELEKAEELEEKRRIKMEKYQEERARQVQYKKLQAQRRYVEKVTKAVEQETVDEGLGISPEDVEWNGLE